MSGRALRVGLLGGSFNPAHAGHVHVSLLALERLRLDQVWWLVSPQNPLKPSAGMASFEERLARARAVARDPRIRIDDVERRLGTRYTIDTLSRLRDAHPQVRFVWLMGADNLIQISRWRRWRAIFRSVPIAVFARPTYSGRALAAIAARRFRKARKRAFQAPRMAGMRPPAWLFLHTPGHAASATRIRAREAMSKASGRAGQRERRTT